MSVSPRFSHSKASWEVRAKELKPERDTVEKPPKTIMLAKPALFASPFAASSLSPSPPQLLGPMNWALWA
jgi:hypothetical protein